MKFRISTEAREDLVSVWEYTRSHWSTEQADLYIDAFVLRFAWLSVNRTLWQARTDLQKGIFSYVEKSHVILFSENQDYIDILRILHGRMDLGRHVN